MKKILISLAIGLLMLISIPSVRAYGPARWKGNLLSGTATCITTRNSSRKAVSTL